MFDLSSGVMLIWLRGRRCGLVEDGLLESRPLALTDVLGALRPHQDPPVRPSRQCFDDDLDTR